jgi:hypothetical protein
MAKHMKSAMRAALARVSLSSGMMIQKIIVITIIVLENWNLRC